MTILLATDFDAAALGLWQGLLQATLPDERIVTDCMAVDAAEIDIAIVANPPAGALHGLPHLRLIQSLWAGVDKLLADASLPSAVPIARMVDPAMSATMAETALWAVLSLHRGFYAYLARGAHVVDADLLAALDSGHLQHAVLDVFNTEPLPADHRYWRHPRVTVLPHAAAQTDARSAAEIAAANVRRLRSGDALQNLVNRTRGY